MTVVRWEPPWGISSGNIRWKSPWRKFSGSSILSEHRGKGFQEIFLGTVLEKMCRAIYCNTNARFLDEISSGNYLRVKSLD